MTGYSIFDSAVYRIQGAKWLFPQEKATFQDLEMSASESKMLYYGFEIVGGFGDR